jgi:integrase
LGAFLTSRVTFTAGRVAAFTCPADKVQAFLWDAQVPGLGLRATPNGKPAYIFQSVYAGKTLRLTIGAPAAWTIGDARIKARELQTLIDAGRDPRAVKAERAAADKAARAASAATAATVAEAWAKYLAERKAHWGERTYADHEKMAKAGGEPASRGTRGKGKTIPGPLHALLPLRLSDLTPEAIEAWAAREGKARPTYGRLAWRYLRAFLNWCGEHPEYRAAVSVNPAKTRRTREAFGKPRAKTDALLREQLPAWFAAVRDISAPTIAAALQIMLLTGAREGEVLTIRWEDINERWRGLVIRDKVEGERVIPLTPYVHHLLASLPRRNEWVFSSPASASGRIAIPSRQHSAACNVAGIEGMTLHGLRRSFGTLSEWLELPAGVVAQIQGHKPSATAEKHYRVRPLDLLRVHHERLEAWMLEQAGIELGAAGEPGKLQLVAI